MHSNEKNCIYIFNLNNITLISTLYKVTLTRNLKKKKVLTYSFNRRDHLVPEFFFFSRHSLR